VKLKLTGLEFELEGSGEDVPLLTKNIASQLAGVLTPAASRHVPRDRKEPECAYRY
jgi:hypothetical protein